MAINRNGRTFDREHTKITQEIFRELAPGIVRNAGDAMQRAWATHGDAIMGEIEAMAEHRANDPYNHARAALITSILSPGVKLDKNIRQARRAMNCLYRHFRDNDAVYQCITDNRKDAGGRCGGQPAIALYQSLDFIRHIDPELMTKPALMALAKQDVISGIGHKTASFAAALYDVDADVFTLDVHMQRWVCDVAGRPDLAASKMEINDAPYAMLEALLVGIARAALPGVPMFGIQWACWNEVSEGEHRTHLGIFGLD